MELSLQLKSLIFSFFFGIIFSTTVNLFEKKLYYTRLRFQIGNAFLVSILLCLIYFISLRKINNGIIHIYFIFMIILGFLVEQKFLNIVSRIKKSRLIKKINTKKRKKC